MNNRVFIGVGHGGRDPGVVANGLKESDVNLAMALAMQKELVRHGITVGISRSKDENDSLSEEIYEANRFRPDLAVEIHNNAGGGKGFEVYRQTSTAYADQSFRLAQAMEAEVKKIGQNSRGIKTRANANGADYFGWLREVKAPAVLCEGVFLDNADDAQIINSLEKQEAFGIAYAKGVLAVLGIEWIPSAKVLYGVVGQKIALSDREAAEKYAAELNRKETQGWYWKVIEIS